MQSSTVRGVVQEKESNVKSFLIAMFLFTSLFSFASAGDHKVWVCHYPPGNPANAHAIHISENAVSAHVGPHEGDFVMENENSACPVQVAEPTAEPVVTPAPTEPAPVVTPNPTETTPDSPVVTPVPSNPDVPVVTTPDAPSAPNAPQSPVTTQAGVQAQPAPVTGLPSTGSGTESNELTQYIALGVASLMFAGTGLAVLRKE